MSSIAAFPSITTMSASALTKAADSVPRAIDLLIESKKWILMKDTKRRYITQATLTWMALTGVASTFGWDKENSFGWLRDRNNLTDLEAFAMLFGQQLCAALAFTALEIREDMILPPEENACRGVGTNWPRSRVYSTIYLEFPIWWTTAFALFMTVGGPSYIFSTYESESWAVWVIKMVVWFIVWEFMMYSAHRIFHAYPWLYKIAHKGHHVVMDFPLGPHAPALEKLSHYVASIIASYVVGISAGSWVFALNILMTQCVLEHAYSSFTLPLWHTIFAFNTADLHQDHHIHNNANFGYAFNIFDPIFGTLLASDSSITATKKAESLASSVKGTAARIRFLISARFRRAIAGKKSSNDVLSIRSANVGVTTSGETPRENQHGRGVEAMDRDEPRQVVRKVVGASLASHAISRKKDTLRKEEDKLKRWGLASIGEDGPRKVQFYDDFISHHSDRVYSMDKEITAMKSERALAA